MAKFRSPFDKNELWITQTYHSGSNNTAVDFSAVTDTPVYAVADGKVTYRSSGYGSYCIQQIDNSDLRVYYVHTYKWVGANTHVKKGQVIARIAPSSVNGGYPTHLHLGLQIGKYLMDYMDRSITMKTRFSAIKNIWFRGESFDWGKHKDLSYLNSSFKVGDKIEFTGSQNIRKGSGTSYAITGATKAGQVFTIEDGPRIADGYTWYDLKGADWVADVGKWKIYVPKPTPPPEPAPEAPKPCPDCSKYKKEVLDLLEKTEGLERELEGQKQMLKEKNIKITSMGSELEEIRKENNNLTLKLAKSEDEKLEWMEKHDKLKQKLEEGKTNFIKQITGKIGEFLAKVLGGE